jgi:hypothetical protein
VKRLVIAGALLMSVLAVPAEAGRGYRFDASVRCIHYLTEDAAAHIKLIKYDTSGESLRLVYRCRSGY